MCGLSCCASAGYTPSCVWTVDKHINMLRKSTCWNLFQPLPLVLDTHDSSLHPLQYEDIDTDYCVG